MHVNDVVLPAHLTARAVLDMEKATKSGPHRPSKLSSSVRGDDVLRSWPLWWKRESMTVKRWPNYFTTEILNKECKL